MKEFDPKIVVFCCNWSAYPAVEQARQSGKTLPAHVKCIQVMCGGMVTPAYVLKSFELGADGVLIATCHVDDCHYVTGAKRAADVHDTAAQLITMLGIEPGRLKLGWFNAQQVAHFRNEVEGFITQIRGLGPSSRAVIPSSTGRSTPS
ncbi:hydrogenase iron-sulfur subunit [candidate division WOR-3 bacterium]|nr:hydrogenase iron-sulfur subunit [candidate division WOR-3 bacterium]